MYDHSERKERPRRVTVAHQRTLVLLLYLQSPQMYLVPSIPTSVLGSAIAVLWRRRTSKDSGAVPQPAS